MKTLIAGCYAGEFGWELMAFQGLVRRVAKAYDRVIVCTYTTSEHLYADFCKDFISHEMHGPKDCWHPRQQSPALASTNSTLSRIYPKADRLVPLGFVPITAQDFIKFGNAAAGKPFDVLVHARDTVDKDGSRSWPLEYWNDLVSLLCARGLTVGAIGTEAWCPEQAEDLRQLSLAQLCNTVAASDMMLGPSSGPMHLASLCGTPHFVWSDTRFFSAVRCKNRQRYETLWNPLQTPCKIFDGFGWNPPVKPLFKAILEARQEWNLELKRLKRMPGACASGAIA